MKLRNIFLMLLTCIGLTISCKDDPKEGEPEEAATDGMIEKTERVTPTKEDLDRVNSVMARLMVIPEAKQFSSLLVSAQVAETLMQEKGPFTVFSPTDQALEQLDAEFRKNLQKEGSKQMLTDFVKHYIVSGEQSTVTIYQKIRELNGLYPMLTLAGDTLTASKKGNELIITASNGKKASIGKSDISGSNGVVHLLDTSL